MTTFTVTITTDELDDLDGMGTVSLANFGGAGDLSLREAISLANAMAGVDTITFASGMGDAFENDALIRLTQGELVATEALNIDGSTAGGAVVITGDADGDDLTVMGTDITDVAASGAGLLDDNSRVLNITANTGTSTLTGLTITGGRTTGSNAYGGGVSSVGAITLANSTVSGNSTTGQDANGGGIYSRGATTLTNSTLSGNSTAGNSANGGGIAVFDQITITNSIVLGNTTSFAGLGSDEIFEATFSGGDGTPEFLGGNIVGAIGGNIVGANSSAFDISGLSNVVNADPAQVFALTQGNTADASILAGVLGDNGGPVETIALLADALNPALDVGDAPNGVTTDANGNARMVDLDGVNNGGTVDAGAVELAALPEADSLIVTTTADVVDAFDGETSLREAIAFANATSGVDTVSFASGVGETFEAGGTIRLTQGELLVTEAIDIVGVTDTDGNPLIRITGDANGDDVLGADGNTDVGASLGSNVLSDNSRVLNLQTVASTESSISGLIITGGRTTADDEGGAGIRSQQSLSVANSIIVGNSTDGDVSRGGGIFSRFGLTLENSEVSGNATYGDNASGGGIYSTANFTILSNSTVDGNSTSGFISRGGGLYVNGELNLANSTISNNATSGQYSDGGGFNARNLRAVNSTISQNSTSGTDSEGGGAFIGGVGFLDNTTVTGNFTAGDQSTGGGIYSRGEQFIDNSIILGNETRYAGVGGDEIYETTLGGNDGTPTFGGANIVGANAMAFDTTGLANVFNADPANTFEMTQIVGSVVAGVLADNGGPVETIALLDGGAAEGVGDASLIPLEGDFRIDVDGDGDTLGTISLDANGNLRLIGALDLGAVEAPEAPSLIVTTSDDIVDAFDGETSLREAIAFANGQAGDDIISFDATVFTGGADSVIRLTQGELLITDGVTIDGASGTQVLITGDANGDDLLLPVADSFFTLVFGNSNIADNSRVFNIDALNRTVVLQNLSITGGVTSGDPGDERGAGVRLTNGSLELKDSLVLGNFAAVDGGGVSNGSDNGILTITNSSVILNQSGRVGGGLDSSIGGTQTIIENSEFNANQTVYRGGAIYANGGDTVVRGSTFTNNFAGVAGGAIAANNGEILTAINATFAGNSTNDIGGAVYNGTSSDTTIVNSTLTNNTAVNFGGGISNAGTTLTLENSILLGNMAMTDEELSGNLLSVALVNFNIIGTGTVSDPGGGFINADPTLVFEQTETGGDGSTIVGVISDNGGPVNTVALRAALDNPALDTGLPPADLVDANGNPREIDISGLNNGGTVDAGAVEVFAESPSLLVTTADDLVNPFDGETSLREAIAFANDMTGADTITFASGMGEAFENDVLIRLTQGELVATEALNIDGSTAGGAVVITGDADGNDVTVMGTDITDVAASGAGLLDDNSR
ncbi:MAG: choice-of-anchor Q domain-containing protein, partial [Pseudomonadota bacterium]